MRFGPQSSKCSPFVKEPLTQLLLVCIWPSTDSMTFGLIIIKCPSIMILMNVTLPRSCIFITSTLRVTFSELESLDSQTVTLLFSHYEFSVTPLWPITLYCLSLFSIASFFVWIFLGSHSIVKTCYLVYCLSLFSCVSSWFGMSMVFIFTVDLCKATNHCIPKYEKLQFNYILLLIFHWQTGPWGSQRYQNDWSFSAEMVQFLP